MAGVLDADADIVLLGELQGCGYVRWLADVHIVGRKAPKRAARVQRLGRVRLEEAAASLVASLPVELISLAEKLALAYAVSVELLNRMAGVFVVIS